MKLSSGYQAQPQCVFAQESSAFRFLPYVSACPRAKKGLAASCSLGTGACPRVTGAGNQLQTCSPSGRRRMGPEKALWALAPAPNPSPAREGPRWAHLRKGTKRASGSCLLERETLLGKASSAPVRVCSAKQRLLVSPLGLCSPFGLRGYGLPPAPCAPVLCWWLPELETNSKRALLREEGG